ncbi:MAG: phosphoribosylglycinamide formyltransferase [Candidatus Lokiarchaeota archaeon]|nr:phosphoribosylglycinamide formyltransferase [Candidatus Lokiarchaeota archaeon]
MPKTKIGAIASGSGSNFDAIVKSTKIGLLKNKASVEVLICNKVGKYCIERAKNHDIPHVIIESDKHEGTREEFDAKMIDVLKKFDCDLIVLVGYMRLVSTSFIRAFNGNVMNIHPALLPSFKGMHAHRDVLEYGVKVTGCTVHFVDPEEDHGPIILQKCVPVLDSDTEDSLGERVLEWEHKIFPKCIELFHDKRLRVVGRKVFVEGYIDL